MGKLFGTDGVRGIANVELTVELATAIGRAAAIVLAQSDSARPKILIGKDTRASGDMLESALAAGFCSVGADVYIAGVVPTPAVAYLVQKYGMDAGVMISASHNPCEYNGIKLFSGDGFKLPDSLENEIESIILNPEYNYILPTHGNIGNCHMLDDALVDYVDYITSTVDVSFEGMRVALDCANGSSAMSAKVLFETLGADVTMLSDTPDGVNINDNCGSTCMDNLIKTVKNGSFDCGFAFDGDADRCLAVDGNGELVDGDKIIAICAVDLKNRGLLKGNRAVVTVMSNMGFFKCANDNGFEAEITKVGDRYVLEEMVKGNYIIGGEQSGHVIFLEYNTTGDGQLSAVQLLAAMKRNNKSLAELAEVMTVYPQVMVNITVSNDKKSLLDTDTDVIDSINAVTDELGQDGRILVRASGTEPLVRVMLEGVELEQIKRLAYSVSEVIANKLDGKIK